MRLEVDKVALTRAGTQVLSDVTLSLQPGTRIALCGPNGAGKSSLIGLLAGDLGPSRGDIRLDEQAPARIQPARLAQMRAVLVQQSELTHPFTVDRVVALGRPDASAAQRGLILAELGIAALAQRIYTQLSGGEQRLVQMARVLLQCDGMAPGGWLLLDEPQSHLDLGVVQRVMHAATRRANAGVGVIAAIHDLELASRWADRVILLAGGSIAADAAPRTALTPALVSRIWDTPVTVSPDAQGPGLSIRLQDGQAQHPPRTTKIPP